MSILHLLKHVTLTTGIVSLIGLANLFNSHPSPAAIINGCFETGDFSGWSTIGNATIEMSASGNSSIKGTYKVLLSTKNTRLLADDFEVEEFLSLPIGSLDALAQGQATSGSAIQQTFSAKAGDVLSFKWNFVTDEVMPKYFNDFAFVKLISWQKLADNYSGFYQSLELNNLQRETGIRTFSYTFTDTGNYTLGLGIMNVGDRAVNSRLLIEQVKLSSTSVSVSVPEPDLVVSLGWFSIATVSLLKLKQR